MRCFILAGGHSSRFGRDKARELVDGVPLIEHAARAARPHVGRITVVAEVAGKYEDIGHETMADAEPGQGPLGGLCTALACLQPEERCLVLSCDLLGIDSRWIALLVAAAANMSESACLYETDPMQPLVACYAARIAKLAQDRLAQGQGSMHGLLAVIDKKLLPPPPNWEQLRNVNRPSDIAAG